MAKTLCEMKDVLKHDFELFAKHVRNPTHACRKCGRAANSKRKLCKPMSLKEK